MDQPRSEVATSRLSGILPSAKIILGAGIALRALAFAFIKPDFGPDKHWLVVAFIAQQGRLPHSGELGQAYHPFLYYLLAAPIYRLSGSFKAVQVLSLVLSILTLIVLYHLIYRSGLIAGSRARLYCLALACFLPQLVLFGLFVSNDTLCIFLGCCVVWSIARLVHSPDIGNLCLLGLVGILGLLTKATFFAYFPVLCALVLFVWMKTGRSLVRSLTVSLTFALVLAAAGSYKPIDNYRHYGHAFLSNIDFNPPWLLEQQQSYQGVLSYVNFDIRRLIAAPTDSPSTERSYPLVLYATFWYPYVRECSFIGSRHRPFTFLAVAIYLLALIPTAAFIAGMLALFRRLPNLLRRFRADDQSDAQALIVSSAMFLLIANLGILLAAVTKYHCWSIMQGRLLFPSFFGILAVFACGVELAERIKWSGWLLKFSVSALCVLFGAYLLGEIGVTLIYPHRTEVRGYVKTIKSRL